jgi:hypothetical protein
MNQLPNIKAGIDASYKTNEQAKQILADQGFVMDDQLSGKRAKVFLDGEGKPVVSFTGTHNRHDVLTDAMIMAGLGKYTKRVKHSKKVVKDVKNKYGEGPQAIGHSLGGYLAENSGAKNVVTYNKLALPFQSKNPFQTDIRTSNDMASVFSNRKNKNITLKSKSWNPFVAHSTKSLKNKNAIKK